MQNPGALVVQLLGYHVYEEVVHTDQVKELLVMYPHDPNITVCQVDNIEIGCYGNLK